MLKRLIFFIIVLPISLLLFAQQHESDPPKFALVIGNGAYTNLSRLANPVNDADDITAALQKLGFTVDKVVNGSLDQMDSAVMRLKNRLSVSKDSYGFFFYAGHGVQSNGENYLIPVDANIPGENFLKSRSMSVQVMLDELNDAGNSLNVMVLDACRDNPFGWSRSGSRGLALVGRQPADSIIVYATSAGQTASDGTGRNGLFTSQLLPNLAIPGLEVTDLFKRTGADVAENSKRQQIPAVYSQFFGTAYLGMRPAIRPLYDGGKAEEKAIEVGRDQPVTSEFSYSLVTRPSGSVSSNYTKTSTLSGIEMIWVTGGSFELGRNLGTGGGIDAVPVSAVTITGFYLSKYAVTQEQYQLVMGSNPSHFSKNPAAGEIQGRRPVEQVSWHDAIEFCNKLSMMEGLTPAYRISNKAITIIRGSNGYRLPTEAQWEYAAKGGNTGESYTYAGSNDPDTVAWSNSNSNGRTHEVGLKAPNGLGLYDMSGNVMEWCWDKYGSYTKRAKADPAGASSGSYHVRRGGDWGISDASVRSVNRDYYDPNDRGIDIGFRVALSRDR